MMINMIDTSKWKDFRVGDLFDIHPTKAYKMTNAQLLDNGDNPVVANSSINNGVIGYTTQKPTEKGNMITFSDTVDANTIFYQPNDFVGYPHVQGLYPKIYIDNWNKYTYQFFTSVFRRNALTKSFDYGNKFRREIANDLIVKLPTTSDNIPDWLYMEKYMIRIMEISIISLNNLKKNNNYKQFIPTNKWKSFKIEDLFEKLNLKCLKENFNKSLDCSSEPTSEFCLPLTNARHFNNGIQFYGRIEDWEFAEMTIDIVSNGAIATGDVYAQPQKTGVLWDSYLIKCKYDIQSELVLHYLACIIEKSVKQFFGWDNKCTWDKVKGKTIFVPVTNTNEPDWQFMENYMKKIMDKSEKSISILKTIYK